MKALCVQAEASIFLIYIEQNVRKRLSYPFFFS